MVFRADDFKIFVGGVAKPNKFAVDILSPWGDTETFFRLKATCEASELPGKGFSTTARNTYGPPRSMPYQVIYNQINMTFICGADMQERYFFDRWQQLIQDYDTHYQNYYDNYTTTIVIRQYSDDAASESVPGFVSGGLSDFTPSLSYLCFLHEAWPITIGAQTLSWSASNQYLTLPVTFAYWKWFNHEQWYNVHSEGEGTDMNAPYEMPDSLNLPSAPRPTSPGAVRKPVKQQMKETS